MPMLVNTPRWREMLNRIFVSKRQGLSDLVVLDDVFPVAAIYDAAQSEYHWDRDEHVFMANVTSAAVAGQVSFIACVNNSPDGLVCVERISAFIAAGGAIQAFVLSAPAAPAGATFPYYNADTRGPQLATGFCAGVPFAIGSYGSAAALPAAFAHVSVLPTVNLTTEVLQASDIILRPGWGVFIFCTTVNTAISGTIAGYTRLGEPDELK